LRKASIREFSAITQQRIQSGPKARWSTASADSHDAFPPACNGDGFDAADDRVSLFPSHPAAFEVPISNIVNSVVASQGTTRYADKDAKKFSASRAALSRIGQIDCSAFTRNAAIAARFAPLFRTAPTRTRRNTIDITLDERS